MHRGIKCDNAHWQYTLYEECVCWRLIPRRLRCEIQHKRPQFQHRLYQECGFLCLISGCMQVGNGPPALSLALDPTRCPPPGQKSSISAHRSPIKRYTKSQD
eukprot:3294749-Rhodomonas_salina.4